MLIRSLALAVAGALTSQAFLIPSSISEGVPSTQDKTGVLPAVYQNGIMLKIDCNECSTGHLASTPEFAQYHDEMGALVLNFSIARSADQTLLLNDAPIYPHVTGTSESVTAPQIGASLSLGHYAMMKHDFAAMGVDAPAPSARLGYALMARQTRPSDDLNDQIVSISFRIVEVGDVFVTHLDRVEITLIRTDDNELILLNAEKIPIGGDVASPAQQGHAAEVKECSRFPLLCKWKALATAKFHGMKSSLGNCRKYRPHHHAPTRFRHHHDHGSHRQQHQPTVALVLRRVIVHVIVPVLVGIVAGMTAGMIGMLVGQLVVLLWRKVTGRGPQGSSEGSSGEHGFVTAESKGLLEEAELPQYEEAPQYEEVVAENEKM